MCVCVCGQSGSTYAKEQRVAADALEGLNDVGGEIELLALLETLDLLGKRSKRGVGLGELVDSVASLLVVGAVRVVLFQLIHLRVHTAGTRVRAVVGERVGVENGAKAHTRTYHIQKHTAKLLQMRLLLLFDLEQSQELLVDLEQDLDVLEQAAHLVLLHQALELVLQRLEVELQGRSQALDGISTRARTPLAHHLETYANQNSEITHVGGLGSEQLVDDRGAVAQLLVGRHLARRALPRRWQRESEVVVLGVGRERGLRLLEVKDRGARNAALLRLYTASGGHRRRGALDCGRGRRRVPRLLGTIEDAEGLQVLALWRGGWG